MAKIHVLESILSDSPTPRTGTIHCLYHINITAQKNTSLDVTEEIQYSLISPTAIVTGAMMRLGASSIDLSSSTHPDFGATTEDALLASQDIAEIDVQVSWKEGEATGAIASRVDGLFNGVQNRGRVEYTERYQWYGTERNP